MVDEQQALDSLDAAQLREVAARLLTQLRHSQALNEKFAHENALLKRMKFAAQSERHRRVVTHQLLQRIDVAQVDGAGRYWSAGVSAGAINILAPDGTRQGRIALPSRAPTMCTFGTADDLWVTSLVRPGWEPTEQDGALLRLRAACGAA